MTNFDAIIVGGGPSGAICASYLAKAGWRVAILEQARFPRHQIGESLLPWTRQVFTEIGFDEICQRERLIVKRGAIFHSQRTGTAKNFDFHHSLNPEFSTAYTVDRCQFDTLLLDHAANLGATVFQPCRFTEANKTPEGYEVNGRWRTNLLIMAAGTATKSLFPDRYLENRDSENRSAVFGYFAAPKKGPYHHLFGNISINIFYLADDQRQPYWSWATPIRPDVISVGFVLPTATFRQFRAEHPDEGSMLKALFAANDFQRPFVADESKPLSPLQYRKDFQRIPKSIVGDNLLFVGDSAGFIDPVFSSGVHLGALSAKMAAKQAIATRNAGLPFEERYLLDYKDRYLYHFWLYYRFVAAFYQKNVVEKIFLTALYSDEASKQKQREFSSLLAGDSHSPNALFDMIVSSRVQIDPAIKELFAEGGAKDGGEGKNNDQSPRGKSHDNIRSA